MSIEHAQIHSIGGNLQGGAGQESVGGDVGMRQNPEPLTRHLRIHRDRGHTVLEFRGEIDILAAVEIMPFLDSATIRRAPRIVIDLRPVEFFDCSGLRLLFRARRRVLARGGTLHLVCTHPLTLRVLRITGVAELLPPSASLEEALSQSEAAGSL
jgi:anti-sigma B factor antagonist